MENKASSDLGCGGRNLAVRPECTEGQIQVFSMGKGKKECAGCMYENLFLGMGGRNWALRKLDAVTSVRPDLHTKRKILL